MEKLYRILSKVAGTTHPVLIVGESGTGKELVARSIHTNGPTRNKPFIPVDCGSLAPAMIEGELFGHAKGAFTGATRAKTGLLAGADGGTIFLDEIGELPLDLQGRLLRALQDKEVRPVGSDQGVPLHARILASTTRDLTAAWSRPAASAKTSTSASTSSPSASPPCASGAATSPCSPRTSSTA